MSKRIPLHGWATSDIGDGYTAHIEHPVIGQFQWGLFYQGEQIADGTRPNIVQVKSATKRAMRMAL